MAHVVQVVVLFVVTLEVAVVVGGDGGSGGGIISGGGSSGSGSNSLFCQMRMLRLLACRVVSPTPPGRQEPHLASPHTAGQVWGCFCYFRSCWVPFGPTRMRPWRMTAGQCANVSAGGMQPGRASAKSVQVGPWRSACVWHRWKGRPRGAVSARSLVT